MGRIDRFDNNSQIGEFSVLSLGICDPSIDMNTLDGDELVICPRDVGISGGDEEWLCLLYSASSGSVGDISVAVGLDCKGLDHWRGIVWDPGIVGKRCLHVCYDCLCLIVLCREAMILVHDWAALSMWIETEIGYCRTITWELGCLASIHPPCDVDRFFGRDVWQIKELEAMVTPVGCHSIPAVRLWVRDFGGCHCPGDASDPGDWAVRLCGWPFGMLLLAGVPSGSSNERARRRCRLHHGSQDRV